MPGRNSVYTSFKFHLSLLSPQLEMSKPVSIKKEIHTLVAARGFITQGAIFLHKKLLFFFLCERVSTCKGIFKRVAPARGGGGGRDVATFRVLFCLKNIFVLLFAARRFEHAHTDRQIDNPFSPRMCRVD